MALRYSQQIRGFPIYFYDLADKIASGNGDAPEEKWLILGYEKTTGFWIPVNNKAQLLADLTGGLTANTSYH
jgi:hypothetical protein